MSEVSGADVAMRRRQGRPGVIHKAGQRLLDKHGIVVGSHDLFSRCVQTGEFRLRAGFQEEHAEHARYNSYTNRESAPCREDLPVVLYLFRHGCFWCIQEDVALARVM